MSHSKKSFWHSLDAKIQRHGFAKIAQFIALASTGAVRMFETLSLIGYNLGMKLPRFRLRTLLIAIAVLSIPMGWVAYQLNWIRQRRNFLNRPHVQVGVVDALLVPRPEPPLPWQLKLFGEPPMEYLSVPNELANEAKSLFPEAEVGSPG